MRGLVWVAGLAFAFGCGERNSTKNVDLSGAVASEDPGTAPPVPVSIKLSPDGTTTSAGSVLSFSAIGVYAYGVTRDLTSWVTFSGDNPATLDFSDPSKPNDAVALTAGTVQVAAKYKDLVGQTTIQVSDATLKALFPDPLEVKIAFLRASSGAVLQGDQQLAGMGVFSDHSVRDLTAKVAWASSNPEVIGVSADAPGLLQAKKSGTAKISMSLDDVKREFSVEAVESAPVLLTLKADPNPMVLPLGLAQELKATGTYSDGVERDVSQEVVWTTLDPTVAAVGGADAPANRIVSAGLGKTNLEGRIGNVVVPVAFATSAAELSQIVISPDGATIPRGLSEAHKATGRYSDGREIDLTSAVEWSVSNGLLASVETTDLLWGTVKALQLGSTDLVAKFRGIEGTSRITVSAAKVEAIDISPTSLNFALGESGSFAATAKLSDGTSQVVTLTSAWSSSNPAVLDVLNDAGNKGRVNGVTAGSTFARAQLGTISKIVPVTVRPAEVVSLAITSALGTTVPLGLTRSLKCAATLTDATVYDCTNDAAWSFDGTNDPSSPGLSFAAYVNDDSGPHGKVYTAAEGMTKIIATYGGQTADVLITVTPKRVISVSVSGPADPLLTLGDVAQLTATAIYTDASTRNVTALSGDPDLSGTWSMQAGTSISVNNTTTPGEVTAVTEGGSVVLFTLNSVAFGTFSGVFNVSAQGLCASPGLRYSFYCWYLGAKNESCDAVCPAQQPGSSVHSATINIAGSAGSSTSCQAVLGLFDNPPTTDYSVLESDNSSGPLGLGCGIADVVGDDVTARYTTTPTNTSDFDPLFRRACACTN